MKPVWSDAPEWANYLAMDLSGTWYWYEYEPEYLPSSGSWVEQTGGRIGTAGCTTSSWDSLEKRMEKE